MDRDKTTLERAFELAASGLPADVGDIRKQLKSEGYNSGQLKGRALITQLRQLLKKAKTRSRTR